MLHEDSTLSWHLSDSDPVGGTLLKDAPEMIAAGQVFLCNGLLVIGIQVNVPTCN